MGATYAIRMIYAPLLMIAHVMAFHSLQRPQPNVVRAVASHAVALRVVGLKWLFPKCQEGLSIVHVQRVKKAAALDLANGFRAIKKPSR